MPLAPQRLTPGHQPGRWRACALCAALAVAALPLAGLVRRLPAALREDYSIGDLASIEIGVIEASHATRLVGQPARFGFYQLGPSHFYLQVPLYELFHHQRFALSLTCLAVNWAALLGLLYALGRWLDTTAATLSFLLVAVPYLGYYESATLFNYWGQYLIVLPAGLFLMSAAAVVSGRVWAWPLVLALGSFMVQGYGSSLLPVAAVLVALALVVGSRRLRRRPPVGSPSENRRRSRAVAAASLLVVALFWCAPVIDEATGSPGNLSVVLKHYRPGVPGSGPPAGAVAASFARHLAAPWLHGFWGLTVNSPLEGGPLEIAKALAAAELLLLAGCAWLAARRGQRYSAALCALCLLMVAAALVAVRRLDGDLYPYIFFWLSACAAVGWMALGGVLLSALAEPLRSRWLRLAIAAPSREIWLLATVAVLAAGLLARPLPIPHLGDPSVGAFAAALDRHLVEHGLEATPIRLVSHDFAWPWAIAMLIQLHHRGRQASIVNVQGGAEISEMQGLRPAWLRPLPGSTEIHLYDRDPGAAADRETILCHAVLPLDATRPEMCMIRSGGL